MVPSRRSQEIYLFSKASSLVLGLTNLLVSLPGSYVSRIKRPRHEAPTHPYLRTSDALPPLPCIVVNSWHAQGQNYTYSAVHGMCGWVTVGGDYLFSIYS